MRQKTTLPAALAADVIEAPLLRSTDDCARLKRLIVAGQCSADLSERISSLVRDVERARPGETMAAFTHFGPMFAVCRLFSDGRAKDDARRLGNGRMISYSEGETSWSVCTQQQ